MTVGARRLVLVLAIAPSLVAGIVGTLLIASWRGELPDPVATHWSSHGADGFSSQTFIVAVPLVVGVGCAVIGALCILLHDRTLVRTAVGLVAGVAVSTISLIVWTAAMQRGADDARAVGTPGWQILGSWFVGVLVGCATAAVMPKWRTHQPGDDAGERPRLSVGDNERIVWTRVVSMSAPAAAVLAVSLLTVAMVAIVTRSWPAVVVVVVLVVVIAAMWSVRITVDRSGIAVRGFLGWPRTVITVAEIDHAELVRVRALRDFGGYGYRIAMRGDLKGAKGFVFRSGEAISVTRRDGRREVVVVDDARTAAGLINSFANPGGPHRTRLDA